MKILKKKKKNAIIVRNYSINTYSTNLFY